MSVHKPIYYLDTTCYTSNPSSIPCSKVEIMFQIQVKCTFMVCQCNYALKLHQNENGERSERERERERDRICRYRVGYHHNKHHCDNKRDTLKRYSFTVNYDYNFIALAFNLMAFQFPNPLTPVTHPTLYICHIFCILAAVVYLPYILYLWWTRRNDTSLIEK